MPKALIQVYKAEQYDTFDWPGYNTDKLVDVIKWFQDKLTSIPEEYRASATCNITSVASWEEDHYVEIEIYYWSKE